MADALLGLLPIFAGGFLMVMPLVGVLASSPSFVDGTISPPPKRRSRGGWRITISVTRTNESECEP